MANCEQDQTTAGARGTSIISLMYGCGLGCEEVVNLDLASYDHDAQKLVILERDEMHISPPQYVLQYEP